MSDRRNNGSGKGRPNYSRNRGGGGRNMGRKRAVRPAENPVQSIVGRNAVKEMLDSEPSRIEKVFLDRKNPSHDLVEIAGQSRKLNVPISYVPTIKLDKLGGRTPHQGVAAQISEIVYGDLEEELHTIAETPDLVKERKPILVVLDGIEDTGNLGAILRSAYGFGVSAVIVSTKSSAPVTAATVKASAGTAHKIPILRASEIGPCLQQLKERGYWIVGTDGGAESSIWDQDWDRPVAIIIGGENKGISEDTRDLSDFLVKIPLATELESLNASVSAAVVLSSAMRGR